MLTGVNPFLDALFLGLKQTGIDPRGYFLDHICYRVETPAAYEAHKRAWAERGDLLHEALIGGRPIAAFKLHEPIEYKERRIPVVELPAPKAGSAYAEGWEHAEFVIDETFAELMARHPQVAWDTSAVGKAHNPELRVGLGNGVSVKFHRASLEDVIRWERAGG